MSTSAATAIRCSFCGLNRPVGAQCIKGHKLCEGCAGQDDDPYFCWCGFTYKVCCCCESAYVVGDDSRKVCDGCVAKMEDEQARKAQGGVVPPPADKSETGGTAP